MCSNAHRDPAVTMSVLKAPIDYKNLEEELHAALAADELYRLQNDAKIRAIEQGVPTYEHFRQMVNGAHLKSLDHDDMKPKIGVQWNPAINDIRSYRSVMSTNSQNSTEKNDNVRRKPAKVHEDFLGFWRTIANYSEKFIYLWNLRNILQTHIFHVEIPLSFFGDFVDVCLQYLSSVDDVAPIIELLRILSTCKRFDLMISFMSKDEQFICEQLFRQLQGKAQDKSLESAIASLVVRYKVRLT